jgi:hypothetical protein
MNKGIIGLGATIGGLIGSYMPVVLFHVDGFSAISILTGVLGGIAGIWAAYKYSV